ncbi:hypothetical protein [Alteribacter aurantiacus]|uniref:hypothetical protein n=1 Tax=Alteribacter aurantiacus TaxID=254410 RepID=UPI0003FB07DC|nr:hypothetical protein [Alteribacter aurantiacus]
MYQNGYTNQYDNQQYQTVLRLIRQLMGWESYGELMIDYLIGQTRDSDSEETLYVLRQDERNHYDTLAWMYTELSGQRANVQTPTEHVPEGYIDGLGIILKRKTKMMKLYVHLYIYSPQQYQGVLYPFLSEEQTHMHMINYLLIRKSLL